MAAWRRYAGPAAFLLAVTIAVLLVRSGLRSGRRDTPPRGSTITRPLVTTATTTAAASKTAAKRYWTVRAGDTFGVISRQTGVPVATIQQLNPTVKSTSLFIGEKLRIR